MCLYMPMSAKLGKIIIAVYVIQQELCILQDYVSSTIKNKRKRRKFQNERLKQIRTKYEKGE